MKTSIRGKKWFIAKRRWFLIYFAIKRNEIRKRKRTHLYEKKSRMSWDSWKHRPLRPTNIQAARTAIFRRRYNIQPL